MTAELPIHLSPFLQPQNSETTSSAYTEFDTSCNDLLSNYGKEKTSQKENTTKKKKKNNQRTKKKINRITKKSTIGKETRDEKDETKIQRGRTTNGSTGRKKGIASKLSKSMKKSFVTPVIEKWTKINDGKQSGVLPMRKNSVVSSVDKKDKFITENDNISKAILNLSMAYQMSKLMDN